MAISCPNKASNQWKQLVDIQGEKKALLLWNAYEGSVPQNYYEKTIPEVNTEQEAISPGLDRNTLLQLNNDLNNKINQLSEEEATSLHQLMTETDSETTAKKNKILAQVKEKMNNFLRSVGVDVDLVDKILDSENNEINALAKADIINKVVQVIEGKADASTLPEETAHIFVSLLPKTHPLYQSMIDKITRFKIYDDVKKEYGTLYNNDETRIREEAIGKLISAQILNQSLQETELNTDLANKWYQRLWNYIKGLLGGLKTNEMAPFIQSAKQVLNGEIEGLMDLDKVIQLNQEEMRGLVYYQLSSDELLTKETLEKALENNTLVYDIDTKTHKTLDGITVKHTPEDFVNKYNARKFREKNEPTAKSKILANKITFISKLNTVILNRILNKQSLDNKEFIINEVVDSLQQNSAIFAGIKKDSGFYRIEDEHYGELIDGVTDIYNQILKKNASINLRLKNEVQVSPKIYTDVNLYKPSEDLSALINIVVVYPNGTIGTYLYEGESFYKDKDTEEYKELGRTKQDIYDIRLSQGKRILIEQYGVEDANFAESRVVPINIQLNFEYKGEGTKPEIGFKEVQMGVKGTREYLSQIPVRDELTGLKELDTSLTKMINLRRNILITLDKNPRNEEYKSKLYKIDKSIKEIQIKQEIVNVYNEVARMYKQLDKLETEPTTSPNYDYKDFLNYLQFAEVFDGFSDKVISENFGLGNLDKIKVTSITMMVDHIKEVSLTKIMERLNTNESRSIISDMTVTDTIGGLFKNLQDYDGEAYKRLAKMIQIQHEVVRQELNTVVETMKEKTAKLDLWAKSQGLSKFDAFRKIYDVDSRKLISKFTKEYFGNLRDSRKSNNILWLKDNMDFDEVKFKEDKIKYYEWLDKEYAGTETFSKEKTKRELEWLKLHDVINYPKTAYANKNNYYLTLKDNPKYYSQEWNYMHTAGNEALRDYYNQYIAYNELFNSMVDKKISKGFVAEIRQDTIDRLSQVGVGHVGNLWKDLVNSLETREYDISDREIDPATGKPIPVIPLLYTDPIWEKLSPKELKTLEEALVKEGYVLDSLEYKEELSKRSTKLEYEKGAKYKSFDLSTSLILFAQSVYMNKTSNDTIDQVKAIQEILKSDKIKTVLTKPSGSPVIDAIRGKVMKVLGVPKSDIDIFDKFVSMYYYGLEMQTPDSVLAEKYSRNKIISLIGKITTLKALPLNIVAASSNAIGLYSNIKTMAAEGFLFNNEQLNNAEKWLMSGPLSKNIQSKKAWDLVHYFEVNSRSLINEKAMDLSGTLATKYITMENMMTLFKKPDDFLDANLLITMLQSHGFDSNGNIKRLTKLSKGTKSLLDLAVLKDGKYTIPLELKDMVFFKGLVKDTATGIKGITSEDNKSLIGSNLFIRALMKFRSWIPGLAKAHYRKLHFNETTQNLNAGRIAVMVGEVIQATGFWNKANELGKLLRETALSFPVINKLQGNLTAYKTGASTKANEFYYEQYLQLHPDKRGKISIEDVNEIRMAKIRGLAKELSIIATLLLLGSLAKLMLPDDPKEHPGQNYLAKTAYKITNRGLLELTFWFNPMATAQLINSPIPDFKSFVDLVKWAGNTLDVGSDIVEYSLGVGDTHEQAITKKESKDKTPQWYYSSGMFPLVGNMVDFLDLWDKPLR